MATPRLENKACATDPFKLEALKQHGELWKIVRDSGCLTVNIRQLLETISPEQREEYFTIDNQGQKLLAATCFTNRLSDVVYAIEELQLTKLPPVDGALNESRFNPLLSALRADEPSPEVVSYLALNGCPVSGQAFELWSKRRCDSQLLRALLEPLMEFGQAEMPAISVLLEGMIGCLGHSYAQPSEHITALDGRVKFSIDDMYMAAQLGYTTVVDQMSESTSECDRDQLADVFELCEVSRYYRSYSPVRKLSYFRKALSLRDPAKNCGRLSFGERRQFDSMTDIEYLEIEISAFNFVGITWQMLLSGAYTGIWLTTLCSNFVVCLRVTKMDELADMRSFVLEADECLPPNVNRDSREMKRIFSIELHNYCLSVLSGSLRYPYLSLKDISGLYYCFWEFILQDPQKYATILSKAILCPFHSRPIHTRRKARKLKQWYDETLFIVGLALSGASAQEGLTLVQSVVLELLAQGATIFALPGHERSTLSWLLENETTIPVDIRKEFVVRMCCSLDTSLSERTMLQLELHKVRRLRCFAAMVCRGFSRRVLEEHLPSSLTRLVICHPTRVRHD